MKKIIYNFLKKRISKPKQYNYYFYRWLIDCIMNHKEVSDVIASISYWMTKSKYNSELSLYITDLFVMNNEIYIYTRRPGFWIGKAGCIIEDLAHSINHNVKDEKINNYKIVLIEDLTSNPRKIFDWLSFRYNNY